MRLAEKVKLENLTPEIVLVSLVAAGVFSKTPYAMVISLINGNSIEIDTEALRAGGANIPRIAEAIRLALADSGFTAHQGVSGTIYIERPQAPTDQD